MVEEIDAPEVAEAMPLSPTLFTGEAYGLWRDVIEAAPEKMFVPILERFRGGKSVSAADYVAGWQKLDGLRAQWQARVAGYDAVLMPTAPNMPPDHDRLMEDDAYYVTENLLTLRNTRVGNLMGLSARDAAHRDAQLRDHAVRRAERRRAAVARGGCSGGGARGPGGHGKLKIFRSGLFERVRRAGVQPDLKSAAMRISRKGRTRAMQSA